VNQRKRNRQAGHARMPLERHPVLSLEVAVANERGNKKAGQNRDSQVHYERLSENREVSYFLKQINGPKIPKAFALLKVAFNHASSPADKKKPFQHTDTRLPCRLFPGRLRRRTSSCNFRQEELLSTGLPAEFPARNAFRQEYCTARDKSPSRGCLPRRIRRSCLPVPWSA